MDWAYSREIEGIDVQWPWQYLSFMASFEVLTKTKNYPLTDLNLVIQRSFKDL